MKIKFIIFAAALLFNSCDLLTTRKAEEPNSSRNNFIPAATADILFSNLKNSFKDKVIENYLACFVDTSFLKKSYKFIPAAGSANQFSVLNNWTVENEQQYFTHLANRVSDAPIILTLTEIEKNIVGDSASYQFDYSLSFSIQDESVPKNYQGSLIFKINIDSQQQWVITEWEDIKKGDFPSWSELKGRFYL